MKEYRVVWEIQVPAENPIEAATKALNMVRDDETMALQYYVQAEDEKQVYSVDLLESNEDAVLPADYSPLIK